MLSVLARDRLTLTWLFLVAVTLLSWESAQTLGRGRAYELASVAAIAIAFIKVRCVGLEFMELRSAPWPARLAFEAWTVGICCTLVALYLI